LNRAKGVLLWHEACVVASSSSRLAHLSSRYLLDWKRIGRDHCELYEPVSWNCFLCFGPNKRTTCTVPTIGIFLKGEERGSGNIRGDMKPLTAANFTPFATSCTMLHSFHHFSHTASCRFYLPRLCAVRAARISACRGSTGPLCESPCCFSSSLSPNVYLNKWLARGLNS